MRKRIVAAFLAVGLVVCQSAFISMAEEGTSGADSDSTTTPTTETVVDGDEEITKAAPQAEQVESGAMEEGLEDAPAAYAMRSVEPAASPGTVSGTYENGMTWEITGEVLTISGNGVVDARGYDYSNGIEDGIDYGKTIKEVIINEGATEIGEGIFSNIDIGGGNYFGGDMWYWGDCWGIIEKVSLPNTVTKIGAGAFCESGIEKMVLPDSVVKIGAGAFARCDSLREINIPDGVTEIENWMFFSCDSLRKIHIPDGVTRIGDLAFGLCRGLEEINIPDSITEIGVDAFGGCTELKKVVIPSSVKKIGHLAFEGGGYEEVIFLGDAPEILQKMKDDYGLYGDYVGEVFQDSIATAYYPAGNPTWTEEARMAIGSQLNWIAYENLQILPEVTDNTYVLGGSDGATIACSGEFKDFVDVYMDDVLVDKENYTVAEGSTILTFTSKYLNTLSVGTHKVTLNYTYGSVDTQLEILAYGSRSGSGEAGVTDPGSGSGGSAAADVPTTGTSTAGGVKITKASPQTGDENRALAWLMLSVICVGTTVLMRKRRINNSGRFD